MLSACWPGIRDDGVSGVEVVENGVMWLLLTVVVAGESSWLCLSWNAGWCWRPFLPDGGVPLIGSISTSIQCQQEEEKRRDKASREDGAWCLGLGMADGWCVGCSHGGE